jgi:hypothetical protein
MGSRDRVTAGLWRGSPQTVIHDFWHFTLWHFFCHFAFWYFSHLLPTSALLVTIAEFIA